MAIAAMKKALSSTIIRGVPTNLELFSYVTENAHFIAGRYSTSLLDSMSIHADAVEVVAPGMQSSLQDYPGRIAYWDIGVSSSGAMNIYAMSMANALVGNPSWACTLEMTVTGPKLRFRATAIVALTGACFHAEFEDCKPVHWWTPFKVTAGSVLIVEGTNDRPGISEESSDITGQSTATSRSGKIEYLAVRGGFDVPKYLGSASTFSTGKFGGITGRVLKAGDFLPVGDGFFRNNEKLNTACDTPAETIWPG